MAIEDTVRNAIKNNVHEPAQVYMEKLFYHSLKFKYEFMKNEKPKFPFQPKISSELSYYFPNDMETVLTNLNHE